MKRLRKQTDGSFHLTDVQPHPTGLSTSGTIEVTQVVLSQEDVDAIVKDAADGTGPLDPPVSNASVAAGLSNTTTDSAPAEPPTTPPPSSNPPLRTDGPTLAEYVAAGYLEENYPPAGYAARE
jgi:hypothetical protein